MCGIVGYIGDKQAAPLLLDGLKKLEYRGYDSAGLAIVGDDESMHKRKNRGYARCRLRLKGQKGKGRRSRYSNSGNTKGLPAMH